MFVIAMRGDTAIAGVTVKDWRESMMSPALEWEPSNLEKLSCV